MRGDAVNFSGPLEDRIAIRELCDQYCDGVMSKDMAVWGATWAEDAEWIARGATVKGRAAIVAAASKFIDACSAALFVRNLGRTHIDGNRATGRCYNVELMFFADGPAYFLTYYDDDYIKIDGRWHFQKRINSIMKEGKL
jgi:SnoaL-like domain